MALCPGTTKTTTKLHVKYYLTLLNSNAKHYIKTCQLNSTYSMACLITSYYYFISDLGLSIDLYYMWGKPKHIIIHTFISKPK